MEERGGGLFFFSGDPVSVLGLGVSRNEGSREVGGRGCRNEGSREVGGRGCGEERRGDCRDKSMTGGKGEREGDKFNAE